MKRLKAVIAVLILLMAFSSVPLNIAEADISVTSSTHVNKFPDGIEFVLEAQASPPIKNITLSYNINTGNTPVDGYDRPKFEPGSSVKASHMLEKRKTYIPPGTEVTYKWTIEDESGSKLETQPVTFTYEDPRFNWRSISDGGVILYWYDWHAQSEDIAKQALAEAVGSIKRLSGQLGITYSRPMKIFSYASKRDMDPVLQPRSEGFSQEIVTLGQRTTAEIMLLLLNHFEYKETIAHEVSHMVIHQFAEGPFSNLPAWLDEGLAMNAEKNVPASYLTELKKGVDRDQLISLQSLGGYAGEPRDVMLFYGESYSIVKYLVDNHGQEKMKELLLTLKTGALINEALKQVYGLDVEGLDAQWRNSLGLEPRVVPKGSGATVLTIPTIVPFGSEQPASSGTNSSTPNQAGGGSSSSGASQGASPVLPIAGGIALLLVVGAGAFFFMRRSPT